MAESVAQENKVDLLKVDPVISGQEWICVSFLSSKRAKNCSLSGWKFRGAFPTQAEAAAHAKHLQEQDPHFHIFVGEGFKWLPFDPEPDTVADQEYYEKELNDLMKTVQAEQSEKKQEETERKKKLVKDATETQIHVKRENKVKERLQKKLMQKKLAQEGDAKKDEVVETVEKDDVVEKMEKSLKEDEKKLDEEKKKVGEQSKDLQHLQKAYAKLKEQYAKKQ